MLPPECVIDSPQATIEMVTVAPKGAPPFAISLSKVHVVARPSAVPDAPVAVEVKGPLEFKGLATIDMYAPARKQVLSGGMLTAGKGARLLSGRAKGALLEGTLSVSAGAVLVERVRIACGFLEIPSAPSEIPPVADDTGWILLNGQDTPLDLWSSPGKGERLSIWATASVHPVETRGGFTLVALDTSDGTSLHGWVSADSVSESPSLGSFGAGGYGCGMGFSTHQIKGPAIVKAGTKVSATPGGEPWAVVPRAAKMTVHYYPGVHRDQDEVAIEEIDGYSTEANCPGLSHAYIPAGSYTWVKD